MIKSKLRRVVAVLTALVGSVYSFYGLAYNAWAASHHDMNYAVYYNRMILYLVLTAVCVSAGALACGLPTLFWKLYRLLSHKEEAEIRRNETLN